MYTYENYEKDSPRIKVLKLSEKIDYNIDDLLNCFRSDGIFVKDKNSTVSTIEALIALHFIANKESRHIDFTKVLEECSN